MTNFDGVAEETSVLALLNSLQTTGGRVLDDAPDETSIPVDGYGRPMPYIVASFGVPFQSGAKNGVAFADTARTIPYTMTMVIGVYAGTRDDLNEAYQEMMSALVGFEPNGDNALPLTVPYAYNQSSKGTATRPSIYGKVVAAQTTVNLSPSE